jgi:hypothetical protein
LDQSPPPEPNHHPASKRSANLPGVHDAKSARAYDRMPAEQSEQEQPMLEA